MQPSWNSDTRQFTKLYYKWLEDINRHESENRQRTINDHVKIATGVNNLKGNIAQKLMTRINQATTFDEVHQWISNYFNSTSTGTNEDNKGQVNGVNNYDEENYNKKCVYAQPPTLSEKASHSFLDEAREECHGDPHGEPLVEPCPQRTHQMLQGGKLKWVGETWAERRNEAKCKRLSTEATSQTFEPQLALNQNGHTSVAHHDESPTTTSINTSF
eukprot:4631927-Amphidinium_carterae.2